MPLPALTLAPDPFGEIFRIHANAIKNDPEIRRIGTTVIVQDDSDNDISPDVTFPWVRLAYSSHDMTQYVSEAGILTMLCKFRLEIETIVEGTRLEDSSRFAFAILNAFFPEEATLRASIEARLASAGLQSRKVGQYWLGLTKFGMPHMNKLAIPDYIYCHGWLDCEVPIQL